VTPSATSENNWGVVRFIANLPSCRRFLRPPSTEAPSLHRSYPASSVLPASRAGYEFNICPNVVHATLDERSNVYAATPGASLNSPAARGGWADRQIILHALPIRVSSRTSRVRRPSMRTSPHSASSLLVEREACFFGIQPFSYIEVSNFIAGCNAMF
jgi:hypothetical protein